MAETMKQTSPAEPSKRGVAHDGVASSDRKAKTPRRRGRPPKSDTDALWTRERILDAALEYVGKHGLGDLSLRGFAASIGTTHRNLSYHFASKGTFLAALVDEIETRFSGVLVSYSATGLTPADSVRRMWAEVTQPANLVYGRLAVEALTENLLGRSMNLFQDIDQHWLSALTEVSVNAGRSPEEAAIEGRLSVGVLRGAWADLLTHEDHDAVKAFWDLYLERFEVPYRGSSRTFAAAVASKPRVQPDGE